MNECFIQQKSRIILRAELYRIKQEG